jgi:hypothetical protein
MSDNEEWGPWIEHDGRGKPSQVYGKPVRLVEASGAVLDVVSSPNPPQAFGVNCWDWDDCDAKGEYYAKIIRYRIRKPRGLTILEVLLENLPSKVDA